MQTFSDYYYRLGYAMEKEAAKKKDEGMSGAAKAGLGAAGAGALGAGAYYSPDLLRYISTAIQQNAEPGMMAHSASSGLGQAADFAQQNLKEPMQAAGSAVADKAGELGGQAAEAAGKAGDFLSDKGSEVAEYIKSLMSNTAQAAQ